MGEEGTKAMWARCIKCSHCWAVAYYPMCAATFAKIAKMNSKACPKCGAKGAVVAKQADGVLLEQPPLASLGLAERGNG